MKLPVNALKEKSAGVRNFLSFLAFPNDLKILLALSAVLLLAWAFVVPVFEAPDEPHHWTYARYVHDHWRLPPYDAAVVEGNQPPLYYYLIGAVSAKMEPRLPTAWIDQRGVLHLLCPPRFYDDCLSDFRKFWPLRWARLITAVLSVITVLFSYLSAYEASASRYTAFTAGALVAFLPGFSFRATTISNDAMVATTSAIAMYLIIRLIARGFSWKLGALAAVFVALAFLSKISAMIFVPVLALALVQGAFDWRVRAKRLSLLTVTIVCTMPWLIRNQILYGDLLTTKTMLNVASMLVAKKSISSPYFSQVFPKVLATSFVGVFGWMNVFLPKWIYELSAGIGIAGLLGFIYSVAKRAISRQVALVLIALPVLAFASVVQLNLTFSQPQGRYLFPALSAFMVLLAIGITSIPKLKSRLSYVFVAVCIVMNLYALLHVELRAYWRPKLQPIQTALDTEVASSLMSGGPIGPLSPGGEFGQTFIARGPNLSSIEVPIATYGHKIPVGFVILHLRRSPQDRQDIATVAISATKIVDSTFVPFAFPPLKHCQGKSYYFSLDTRGIPTSYPVTVYVSRNDVYPEGEFFMNKRPTGRDISFRTFNTTGGRACLDCND